MFAAVSGLPRDRGPFDLVEGIARRAMGKRSARCGYRGERRLLSTTESRERFSFCSGRQDGFS